MIVPVTKEQAQHVQAMLDESARAHAAAQGAVTLLTLGRHVPPTATLAQIDTENGALVFHVEPPTAPTEGD